VIAGKAIFEMGKQGAAVIQTGESFDFLLKKLDLAPDLLEQLREASRGTVDDMTLMSGTATLLAGTSDELGKKMGNLTPKLMEIAKAANKLNPSLGDTAFMYQSIATGIKRAQPLILDNLGLTIKVGEANEAMAKSLGKTVEELTAEEKAMAILNDTMRAGDLLIDQVGGTTESAADEMERMEANVTNLKNEILTGLVPSIGSAVEFGNKWIVSNNLQEDAIAAVNQAQADGIITQRLETILIDDLLSGKKDLVEVYDHLSRVTGYWREEMGLTADQLIKVSGHEKAHVLQVRAETAALLELDEAAEGVNETFGEWAETLEKQVITALGKLNDTTAEALRQTLLYEIATGDLT